MTDTSFEAHKLRALWQSMPADTVMISGEEMRRRAGEFEKRIRSRNGREYIASAIVVAIFCWYATFDLSTILWPIANLTIVVATIYVAWSLHRKARAMASPDVGSVPSLIDFHRQALVRQRDALKTVWRWYVLPFAPGLVLWFVAVWIGQGQHAPRPMLFAIVLTLVALIVILVGAGLIALNLLGAARLQRMIDDLDRYKEKT